MPLSGLILYWFSQKQVHCVDHQHVASIGFVLKMRNYGKGFLRGVRHTGKS